MPTPRNVAFFADPAELRAWFVANHATAAELWVGYHRKRTGRPSVTWRDVVDEALCFGWIDSVRYSLDGDSLAQRVTPRRARSVWSRVNVRRFQELEAQGRVHAGGRAAFDRRDPERSGIYSYERTLVLGSEAEAEFRRHGSAWLFFEAQPRSYRRTATAWVASAKRDETRRRRLEKLIAHSAHGERLPAFRPSRRSA